MIRAQLREVVRDVYRDVIQSSDDDYTICSRRTGMSAEFFTASALNSEECGRIVDREVEKYTTIVFVFLKIYLFYSFICLLLNFMVSVIFMRPVLNTIMKAKTNYTNNDRRIQTTDTD